MKKPSQKFYYIPLTKEEEQWFTKDVTQKDLKLFCIILSGTKRPSVQDIDFFLFMVEETIAGKEYLFSFIIPVNPKQHLLTPFWFDKDEEFSSIFDDHIKENPHFVISKNDGNLLLSNAMIGKKYTEYRDQVIEKNKKKQTKEQTRVPPISQFYQDVIVSYVNDLGKQITKKDSHLKDEIEIRRNQLIRKYTTNPNLPLNVNVSRKNRSILQNMREKFVQQLLQKYGRGEEPLPQQIHQDYRQKIIQSRKEWLQKKEHAQRQKMQQQDLVNKMKPFRQSIRQSIHFSGHDPEVLVEDVLWRPIGLTDPISHQRITKPIVLPSSRAIADVEMVPHIKKANIDPMTGEQLPKDFRFQVNQPLSSIISSLEKQSTSIMDSNLPLPVKVFKLIQLRDKKRSDIDQQRLKK